MAENPYVNKVQKADGTVIMDISEDTATPNDVLNGATFHDRSGTPQTGAVITHNVYDGLDSTSTSDALSANQGKVLNSNISSLSGQIENNTFYTPTVYQSRCTINSGGVVKIGKFVILNIIIKASTTASNSPQILTLPNSYASKVKTPLICMENDENAFGNHLGSDAVCGIHYDKIFIKSITNDNYYFINGVWIADE